MFKKLKTKIILVSSTAIFIFLVLALLTINLINYDIIVNDADDTIEFLFTGTNEPPNNKPPHGNKGPNHISPETPFESRYFSVILNEFNSLIDYDIENIASIDYNTAIDYALQAVKSNKDRGFVGDFRYSINYDNNVKKITFLDCGRKLDVFQNFLLTSVSIAIISLVIIIGILWILSDNIIKPFAINYEKQKTFITDASHELKTPLTIINTNIDILEMEYGNNESFSDIHTQIDRLKDLTNNLVLLTKTEEKSSNIDLIDLPISDIIIESLAPFKTMASSQNKKIIDSIEKLQTIKGNDKSIRQLISILLDNALKYSKVDSIIDVSFVKQKNTHVLTITNESLYKLDKSKINHVFDRFYRLDSSRNSSTGGHGIGLSIAKAITDSHNAKIHANIVDDTKFQICVVFTS